MDAPFDKLTDSDAFEALCFDLLVAEGFLDVAWRGPGADGGRDIEAAWHTNDPAGGVLRTKWHIECKWYSDTVPFSDIEPKLLAAIAARADYLLVITSGRIRVTAQDRVHEWLSTRGSPFRVRYWTGRDVLRLAVKHGDLFKRHFPTLTSPAWASASQEAQRLQTLLGSSLERLAWRVLPSIQLAENLIISNSMSNATLTAVASELAFTAVMLRSHDAFSPVPAVGSSRPTNVAETVTKAQDWVERRAGSVQLSRLDSCMARTSAPLLAATFFELVLNASMFAEGDPAQIALVANETHWTLEIVNKSSASKITPWPIAGYRGPKARASFPSGQGLGCWLAQQLVDAMGLRVEWTVDGQSWVTRVQGATL